MDVVGVDVYGDGEINVSLASIFLIFSFDFFSLLL